MTIFWFVLAMLLGYLFGSIPFALVFGKAMKGVDVREHGSGNLGGTNVIRVLGPKVGIPVIIGDIGKGVAAAAVGTLLAGELGGLLAGVLAVFGHFYPVFAGLRGGKGVATGAGVFLFLAPFHIVVALLAFGLSLLIFGYVSLASILGAVTGLLLFAMPSSWTGLEDLNLYVRIGGMIVAVFIVFKHRSNIKKLLAGEEKRAFRGKKSKSDK